MTAFDAFHFLRPAWILALIPVAALIAWAWRAMARGASDDWAGAVDAHLLKHLTVQGQSAGRSRALTLALATGLVTAVVAMAGPTWFKVPTLAFQGNEPTVVMLSLAQSMNGTDLVPSRLTRAGHKVRDIFERVRGDDTALVIYADRPFVAAPLTSDGAVIRQMLPEQSTGLIPVLGNRLDLALGEAQALLQRAGATKGNIAVLADDAGTDPAATTEAAQAAARAGYRVDVLGVGTEAGAMLQTAEGRAIQTAKGQDVTMHLDQPALRALADAGNGAFALITADDADLRTLLPARLADLHSAGRASDATSDTWADIGS